MGEDYRYPLTGEGYICLKVGRGGGGGGGGGIEICK